MTNDTKELNYANQVIEASGKEQKLTQRRTSIMSTRGIFKKIDKLTREGEIPETKTPSLPCDSNIPTSNEGGKIGLKR